MMNNFKKIDTIISEYVENVIRPVIHTKKTDEEISVKIIYNTGGVEGLTVDKQDVLYKNKKIKLPIISFIRTSDSVSDQYFSRINYAPNKKFGYYSEKKYNDRTKTYEIITREIPITVNLDYDFKIIANSMSQINEIKSKFFLHNHSYWSIMDNSIDETQSVFVSFDSFSNSGGNDSKAVDSFYESTFSIQAKANFFIQPISAKANRLTKKIYYNKTTVALSD